MLLNNDTSSAIKSRQEGRDTLSWIERFGLHLLEDNIEEDNSRLRLTFNKKEENEVLVLRVCATNKNNREGVISAYNCFFKTDGNGYVRFCVNDACDSDAKNLIELMEGAGWKNQSTRNWWDEAFCDGKMDKVDEDTLKREITLTSEYETMNLMKFIECVQNEIGKAVSKLNIEGEKVKKVFLVEQYAMALPVKYALGRMYPNAIGNVFGFIWKYWEEEEGRSWVQNATRFHVPEELLLITLNTSPKMTVGDVVKMGEGGAVFTLPLTKDEGGNCFLPATPIFADSELKWNEITKEDVNADYSVGNLSFKRVRLSIYADGLKKIYVKNNGLDVVACSVYENSIFQIKSLSHKSENSEEVQNPMTSKPKQSKKSDEAKLEIKDMRSKTPVYDDSETLITSFLDSKIIPNNEVKINKEKDGSELIKMAELNGEIQKALTLTMNLLRQKAYFFSSKHYPSKTMGALFDEWINKKRITGASYSHRLIENWEEFKRKNDSWNSYTNPEIPESNASMLDWGNYYVFIEQNWNGLIQDWGEKDKLNTIKANLRKIKEMLRNDSSHQNVFNLEKENVLDLFTHMRSIVEIFKSKDVYDKIAQIRSNVFKIYDAMTSK